MKHELCRRVGSRAGSSDRKRRKSGLYGPDLLLSGMLLAGCQIRTDPYGRTVLSTPTSGSILTSSLHPGGQSRPLSITPAAAMGAVQDQRVIEGHTVQIMAQGNGH